MNKNYLIGSIINGTEYFYISKHFNEFNKNIIYIGKDDREIFEIKDKLHWLLPKTKILLFRSWDQIPYDKVSPSKEIQSERINTLYEISNNNKLVILTSINAIIQKTIDTSFINENVIKIEINI